MVCWLFVGSSIFSAAFALLGGQEIIERWVLSLGLTTIQFMLLAQFIIFILGWPLEWTEIIVIFMPIFIPLLAKFNVDPLFFGLLVALNLQTAFLSPPVAMAAFYLKGVAPSHVTLNQIFAGMMPFMGIQVWRWRCSTCSRRSGCGCRTRSTSNAKADGLAAAFASPRSNGQAVQRGAATGPHRGPILDVVVLRKGPSSRTSGFSILGTESTMKPRVLVTRQVFPEIVEALRSRFDVEHNDDDRPWPHGGAGRAASADKQGVLATVMDRIDEAVLAAAPGPQGGLQHRGGHEQRRHSRRARSAASA